MKIINTDTLEISTDRAVLAEIKKTTSIGPNTLAELGWQPVLAAPKPTPSTNLKTVTSNGATQDAKGNWVDAYTERDMFSDDDESTKAEKETDHLATLLSDRKKVLITRCKADRDTKIMTSETIPFPVAKHKIKIEKEVDVRNLMAKLSAATAIIQAGGGEGSYTYTTADKTQVTMTVQEFSTAALTIMGIKDAIFYVYQDLRALIEAATTESALDEIEGDWPS